MRSTRLGDGGWRAIIARPNAGLDINRLGAGADVRGWSSDEYREQLGRLVRRAVIAER